MSFVIFKNKFMLYREEKFGGIAKYNSQIFILNKKQFKFLENLRKYEYYNDLNEEEKQIANEFLKKGFILKIDSKKVQEIIKINEFSNS
jgi:hypothetical protein